MVAVARVVSCKDFKHFLPPFPFVFENKTQGTCFAHPIPFVGHHRVWFGTWRGNVRVEFHLKSSPDLFFFIFKQGPLLLQQQPPTPTRTRTTKMLPAERATDAKELIFITLGKGQKKGSKLRQQKSTTFSW